MKKNTATKIVFPILDADGDPVTGAAALDSEYSLDGGAFNDCGSEATEIGSTGIYYLNLALGETNGDVVCIQVKTTTADAKTTVLVFYTSAQTLDELDTNVDSILTDTNELQGLIVASKLPAQVKGIDDIDLSATMKASVNTEVDNAFDTEIPNDPTLGSVNEILKALSDRLPANFIMGSSVNTDKDDEIDAVKAKTDNLPADPADESLLETEINANETKIDALQTDVTAIKSYVDTEVAAIKTVTDTLSLAAIADAVLDEVIEGTLTTRQTLRLNLAVLAGKSSGGGTATLIFKDTGDATDRVTATVDANGNRTGMTLDVT